jgi:succinoglycan biosynthesis protein ExoM
VSRPGAPDLSIVVCTYDRPAHLALTLKSCIAQTNALGLSIEIVVVDNHPSGSAASVCEALGAGIRYIADLTRNMSVLRNRGFAEALGDWLAFIDDDEVADAGWTDALFRVARATDADIVVGPRLAAFETGAPPAWDPTGAAFVRDLKLPDRAEVVLTAPSGKPRHGLGTGNSLFNLARCYVPGHGPMREAFGDAGGEDAELFVRLHRQGRKIYWAADAEVTETVPVHRTTPEYRLLRVRRETQHYVTIYLDAARNRRLTWLTLMAKGVVQAAGGFVLALLTLEFVSRRRLRWRVEMTHGLAKLNWRTPVGYIDEPIVKAFVTKGINT